MNRLRLSKIAFLIVLGLIIAIVLWQHGPIPQPQSYHNFADNRMFFSLPNFQNVVSNLIFFLVGLYGLIRLSVTPKNTFCFIHANEKAFYLCFFLGVFLVSFGSGYYHLHPKDTTLIWDRLPIAFALMSFCAAIVSEYINHRWGLILLPFFILFGIFSVLYWYYDGDLRLYIFALMYSLLGIASVLLLFRSNYTQSAWLWIALLLYVVARVTEMYDYQTYHFSFSAVSGHTLKHLAMGFASLCIYVYLAKRQTKISE